jgi:hypothetical protein
MFHKAATILTEAGVEDATRVDVPQKGTGSSDEGGAMRHAVLAIIPALQSGSLFGGTTGVLVADANNLLKAEVDTIAELLAHADPDAAVAVFVSAGALPAGIRDATKASGGVDSPAVLTLSRRSMSETLLRGSWRRRRREVSGSTRLRALRCSTIGARTRQPWRGPSTSSPWADRRSPRRM